jgi:N-acetylmuramoyl-L-alanine amidase
MRTISKTVGNATAKGKAGARHFRIAAVALLCALLTGCAGGVRNTARTFKTVVIDAGHGGHDAGTRSSPYILEKDAALDVARRLEEKVRAAGFRTVMTRKGDYFVTLDKRVAISNRQRNAVFISVHFNESRPNRAARGVETFYYSPVSAELSRKLLTTVASVAGSQARYSKTARFRVLRLNRNPAVLVECGYFSNRAEAARCASPAYRDQLAAAIARGLVEHRR